MPERCELSKVTLFVNHTVTLLITPSPIINVALLNVHFLLSEIFIIKNQNLDHDLDCLFLKGNMAEASPHNFNFTYFMRTSKKGSSIAFVSSLLSAKPVY